VTHCCTVHSPSVVECGEKRKEKKRKEKKRKEKKRKEKKRKEKKRKEGKKRGGGKKVRRQFTEKLSIVPCCPVCLSVSCCLQPRMTMARTIKLYKLPDKPKTPGIRPLEKRDVPQVCVSQYMQAVGAHAWRVASFCSQLVAIVFRLSLCVRLLQILAYHCVQHTLRHCMTTIMQSVCSHQWHSFVSASSHQPISMRHWPSDYYTGDSVAEYVFGKVLTDSYLH